MRQPSIARPTRAELQEITAAQEERERKIQEHIAVAKVDAERKREQAKYEKT